MTDRLDLSGIWALKQDALNRLAAAKLPAEMPSAEAIAASGSPRITRRGSTAIIPIKGIITKEPDIFTFLFGGTATTEVAQELRKAASDPNISDIQLLIDSPGGFASGVGDLGDEIRAVRSQKPIHAHIEDLGASAAYWLAAQATTISGTQHSDVGSIGVFAVAYDDSEMFAKHGVKAHLVSSGGKKGRGGAVAGLPIEKVDLDVVQKGVDTVNDSFVRAVAKGRNMSIADVKALNIGEVWRGAEAKKRGLIDHIVAPTTSPQSPAIPAAATAALQIIVPNDGDSNIFQAVGQTLRLSEHVDAGGETIGMPSNRPAAMEPTEEESSMPDQPSNPPAAEAPDNRAEGRAADNAVLEAINGLKSHIEDQANRLKALEERDKQKASQALADKKDEAIAFGLDEKLVDECESVAEVDRLMRVAKANKPSGGSVRGTPPGDEPDDRAKAEKAYIKLQSDMVKRAEAWEQKLLSSSPLPGEVTIDAGDA